jgi:PIN domain nuclease of toxin-antitoxin system
MSSIILDTCGLIWLVNGGGKLSKETLNSIRQADIVYVSAVSALEIGCKVALNKLRLPLAVDEWYGKSLDVHDLMEIPVSGEIALLSAALPLHHRDPADRIIIATAKLKSMPVVTHDSRFTLYDVTVLR